ncbi:MAG: type II toxin-antitoxin system HicB family antitoxin [Mycobacteriales bacterium]
MSTKRYTARYSFEDGNWLVEIAEFPQIHTFARTLGKARANIRDALGLWLRVEDSGALNVVDEVDGLPVELANAVSEAGQSRARAGALLERAQELTAVAARRLVEDIGLSTRDAAELLGVSHQRVHQLLHEKPAESA